MENGEEGPVMEEETEQERERGEEGEADESVPAGEEPAAAPQNSKTRIIDEFFPLLQADGGRRRHTRSRSIAILSALYSSHIFSAWGDRMWQFLVTLLLALLYPGSLLLPGVFGLVLTLLPAILGTVLGDFVDRNPRMRVVWLSLLIQNSLVCLCAVGLALLFGLNLGICGDVPIHLFIILTIIVIILGATANLATVVNTIAMEKDWIVVIANKDQEVLASLNANMRRIDLLCKLLAPAVAGAILQFAGPLATTIFAAGWNVVSFFGELGLVVLVYRWVPELAVKKLRPHPLQDSARERLIEDEDEEEDGEKEREKVKDFDPSSHREERLAFFDENVDTQEKEEEVQSQKATGHPGTSTAGGVTRKTWLSGLLAPYMSVRDGWKIYWSQEIALAGVSMAVIYLTVLGFSGVTSAYFLTQGVPNVAIGVAQGVGAIFGVTGTFAFPRIRRRVGTVRTGLFGVSSQWAMLLLCLVSVVIPGQRVVNEARGYYSPHCPASGTDNSSTPFHDSSASFSLFTPSRSLPPGPITTSLLAFSFPASSPLASLASTHSLYITTPIYTPLPSPSPSSHELPTPSSSINTMSYSTHVMMSSYSSPLMTYSSSSFSFLTPSPSSVVSGDGIGSGGSGDLSSIREARASNDDTPSSTSSSPSSTQQTRIPSPTPTSSAGSSEEEVDWTADRIVPLVLMGAGIILARFGLWIFDLSIQQRVQETVPEDQRGAVGGVMNAMNSVMDMLHYVLVIVAPRPEHFNILTFLSFGMVTLGAVLYAVYLRRFRGHFFHCRQCWEVLRRRHLGRGSGRGSRHGSAQYRQVGSGEEQQNFLVNENIL